MANPQTQNGFTRISNEVMDHLCCFRIPGEMRLVIDAILRKTYGFNKKEDRISNSQLVAMTGLKKANVSSVLSRAVQHHLVIQKDNTLAFNKDWEQWIPFVRVIQKDNSKKLSNEITGVMEKDNKKLSKRMDTKDSKDNIQKKQDADSRIPFILKIIVLDQGYQWANWPQEAAGVKKCLGLGYTPDEIYGCWKWQRNNFFRGKPLSMQTVAKYLGEYRKTKIPPVTRADQMQGPEAVANQ